MNEPSTTRSIAPSVSGEALIRVATPTLLYVVVEERAVFDAIGLPLLPVGTAPCLAKSETLPSGIHIIFQWWLSNAEGQSSDE